MFVDTSAIIAILAREDDHSELVAKLETDVALCTSPLVVLEATMRLATLLDVAPSEAKAAVKAMLAAAKIEIVAIDERDGDEAVNAFAVFGKGRGHPARLNLADCFSYACAKNRGLQLLYKGSDFARTDLA